MLHELNLYDINISDNELKNIIYKNIDWGIDSIASHEYYIKKIRELTYEDFSISCPIDFPYGLSSSKVREYNVVHLVRQKVKYIDIVINPVIVKNNERKSIIQNIKTIKNITDGSNIELRAIMDYRMFSDKVLFSAIDVVNQLGIYKCIPSSGQYIDDVDDNVINCALIQSKFPKMKTILNTPFVSAKTYQQLIDFNIFGIRLKNFTSIPKKVYSLKEEQGLSK